jgi:hypothetical protein
MNNRFRNGSAFSSSYLTCLIVSLISFSGCYSFKGISIPTEINTFFVQNFNNQAFGSPVDIEVRFSEALRSKIRNESRLKLQETDPDVEFSGAVTSFVVSAEAPVAGNTVALNKLDIYVNVKYTDKRNDKNSYQRSFNFFETFASDQDLQSVQDRLIKRIFDQIVERIFNDTYTTW